MSVWVAWRGRVDHWGPISILLFIFLQSEGVRQTILTRPKAFQDLRVFHQPEAVRNQVEKNGSYQAS